MRAKCRLESLKGRDHPKDLGLDGRIILKCMKRIEPECVDWICVAQDRYQWRPVVESNFLELSRCQE
jgi:hypothetical protein